MIRTVIVTLPRIVSDIVEQLSIDGVQLDICARLDSRARVEAMLHAVSPDLVLIGLAPAESATPGLLLSAIVPNATVIAFTSDARSIHVATRGITRTPSMNLTVEALITVIRDTGRI